MSSESENGLNSKIYSDQDKKRHHLYESSSITEKPRKSIPDRHTMGETAFRQYIGRHEMNDYLVDTKKFSKAQIELIATAYKNGLLIRVISAYRADLHYLLEKNRAKQVSQLASHNKSKKFNCLRQLMICVEVNDEKGRLRQEIWVLCFPSKQYVDQIAELIAAIISDFDRADGQKGKDDIVLVEHYPMLESTIADWTEIEDFASLFIRHGDVVCIGNVELFSNGVRQFSFKPINSEFQYGGLDEMFGVQVLTNIHNYSRIVLIGFKESFWGDASAQFVQGLLNIGASHILYGSKAASMVDKGDVHEIYAPQRFMLWNGEGRMESFGIRNGLIGDFIENLNISHTGYSITVPTVIGESLDQRREINKQGATCMDCENGHIAKIIESHNNYFSSPKQRFNSPEFTACFLPIHFITDYIYRAHESSQDSQYHLGVHAEESKEYRDRRDKSFVRIGNAFGSYALMLGMEDTLSYVKDVSARTNPSEETFEEVFGSIRPLLDAGLGKEALAQLASDIQMEHPLVRAIAQLMICQKHGYISAAQSGLQKLQSAEIYNEIEHESKIRIHTIALKIYSQIGSIKRMQSEIEFLLKEDNLFSLNRIRQFGAVKRREAIFYSLNSLIERAEKCIKEAGDSSLADDDHYSATNHLFLEISRLTQAHSKNPNTTSESLAIIRNKFISGSQKSEWWQTNFYKCATATLFLEAAYFLCAASFKNNLESGIKILTVAHFLNMRLGGNERSEAYGEIVKCTPDKRVKNILCLAMRDDLRAHENYQNWLHANFGSLTKEIQGHISTLTHPIRNAEKLFGLPFSSRDDRHV